GRGIPEGKQEPFVECADLSLSHLVGDREERVDPERQHGEHDGRNDRLASLPHARDEVCWGGCYLLDRKAHCFTFEKVRLKIMPCRQMSLSVDDRLWSTGSRHRHDMVFQHWQIRG